MRALVTGGAGFIGHHLVRGLVDRGDEVTVLDDLSTGKRHRLEPVIDRVRFVEASILDDIALDEAMTSAQVVFHEAALPSVARSFESPLLSNNVNATGTIGVMIAARKHRVRRVILAGSSSVYGVPATVPCTESMPARPVSPYGASKLAAEHYLHTLGKAWGIETLALRYFNVFGPGQDPSSEYAAVVPRFVTAVLEGRRPHINGDGGVTRDFTYVDNVIDANLRAAEPSSPSGLTCNVACGSRTSLLELLDVISTAARRSVDPTFGPPRHGDIIHSMADITLARERIGYEVQVPFREGVERTVEWFSGQSALSIGQTADA
jgi:UDP-glucose 4-epimerase